MARLLTVEKITPRISRTPEGFLVCEAVPIGRTGTMQYTEADTGIKAGPDGMVTISRAPDVVFSDETMRSFEGKPVTLLHPDAGRAPDGMVTPFNWRELAVGSVQNVRRGEGQDSDKLMADLLLTDKQAIDVVLNRRMREVSCGYDVEYEETGPGAGRQTRNTGNHLAIVDAGRAGPECAIMDRKEDTEMSKFKELVSKLRKAVDSAEAEANGGNGGPDGNPAGDKKDAKDMTPEERLARINELEAMLEKFEEEAAGGEGDAKDKAGDEEGEGKEAALAETEEAAEGDKGDAKDMGARMDAIESAVSDIAGSVAKMIDMFGKGGEGKKAGDAKPVRHDADTIARAEILAPGIAKDSATIRRDALVAASKTKEGQDVLKTLNGGVLPAFDGEVDNFFVPAAELLRQRRHMPVPAKDGQNAPQITGAKPPTPAQLNEMNAAHYAAAKH